MRIKEETITGSQLRQVRTELGLDPFAFAALLGVHVSTIYRWEALERDVVRMDPLQRQLLAGLIARLQKTKTAKKEELGQAIVAGLIAGGALAALFVLLKFITDDEDAAEPRKR